MRYIAWCLAASLLLGASAGRAQVAPSELAAADWKKNLTTGPNGPIPAIVVDQFGYPTKSKKVAVIRDPQVGYDNAARFTPGSSYALIEIPSGKVVKSAAPSVWNGGNVEQASGDKAWWFDFSEVEAPGRYAVVDLEKGVRSATFAIGEHVYKDVMKHAVRVYYYQRAGIEKKPEFAGAAWADRPAHVQDAQSRPWHNGRPSDPVASSLIKDLRGGWYDAGDYNKYTAWAARYIIVLSQAYAENPQAFSDDYGIPESGNGIPDLLDEVKWGLDWLIRMQNADGSVLCVQGLASASPPSAAREPSYYGPATTTASVAAAGAFAKASMVFAARPEPELKRYAEDLRKRALAAWAWAAANPNVVFYNNDDSKQPGSKGLAAGQQEMSPTDRQRVQFGAAVFLFELTGEAQFKWFADAYYGALLPQWGASMWELDPLESMLHYASLPGATPEVAKTIRDRNFGNLVRSSETFQSSIQQWDPYRAPMKDYTWGSNKSKAMQGRLHQLVALNGGNQRQSEAAQAAALEYVHYFHGVNPLGLVYLTNMASAGASHSATTMFHAWFRGPRWARVTDQQPGPPPGYLVGGPNPQFSIDSCCRAPAGSPAYRCYGSSTYNLCQQSYAPPLSQPVAKSYLQYNDPWPVNSWEVTEPSLYYQSYYVRLLAAFAR